MPRSKQTVLRIAGLLDQLLELMEHTGSQHSLVRPAVTGWGGLRRNATIVLMPGDSPNGLDAKAGARILSAGQEVTQLPIPATPVSVS